MGDFNLDIRSEEFYARKLVNELLALGIKQYIKDFTRITKSSQTVIDLVFSNDKQNVQVCHTPIITDHAWIVMTFEKSNDCDKLRKFRARDRSKFSADYFERIWRKKYSKLGEEETVDVKANKLIGSIVETLDIVAPMKNFNIPNRWMDQKWYTDEVKEITKARDEAYKRAVQSNREEDWEQYRLYRNQGVAMIRNKKKAYYEVMIDSNKNNPSEMWKTLKEVINGKRIQNDKYDEIIFDETEGKVSYNREEIANRFNEYYITSIKDIVLSIDSSDNGGLTDVQEELTDINRWEEFNTITEEELRNIIHKLPKKKGTDEGISTEVLQEIYNVINGDLLKVINASLSEGIFPEEWKVATVVPIPKVPKTVKASEYRPINVLPIYEKVLELVVKKQLDEFIASNNILIEQQSGFRKGHSCETAIQTVIEQWKITISEKKMVGVIFMDLKGAFETIDKDRLIEKLKNYGMGGKVLSWFKSYVNGRYQKVKLVGVFSKQMVVEYGVPQGSVLGPVLFILYINDIVEHKKRVKQGDSSDYRERYRAEESDKNEVSRTYVRRPFTIQRTLRLYN
ncbi:rna-directed dna polymerase from mobile element jockey-like protein [Lasius niger]|uniref:Rna-directed dna polymerase from mobile element jockey-like protein n=1 Tax=Lasius niger TaxID=67767 RepID=A0A0J7N1N0_LASNI|nr:rna-directed dna polymerase from mobile element jockey-like protein [Lasius niger]